MILPVARRELSTAARNPKFYSWRVRAGLLEILGSGLLFAAGNHVIGRSGAGQFFRFLAGAALLFCLLDGLRKAADSVSEEKRDGTLGLLFLSGLAGAEIVLGKFVAAIVRAANGLLAFVPILTISLLLGGVTGGELWRVTLTLAVTLIASTSLCLFISAATRNESVLKSLGALVALCALPPILAGAAQSLAGQAWLANLSTLSPISLFSASSDAGVALSANPFWIGLAELTAFSLLTLAAASFVITRAWQDRPNVPRESKIPLLQAKPVRNRDLLDENPYQWLCFNARGHRAYIALLAIVGALGILILVTTPKSESFPFLLTLIYLSFLLAQVRTAIQASQTLISARNSGLLELSLGTLMGPRHILDGQWAALRKTIFPMITWAGAAVALVLTLGLNASIIGTISLAQGALGLYVAGWVGIWMALTCKTGGQALFRTLLAAVLIPFVPCLCGISIPIQVALLFIARRKVWKALRALTAESDRSYFSHLPARPLVNESAPPVIR